MPGSFSAEDLVSQTNFDSNTLLHPLLLACVVPRAEVAQTEFVFTV